MIIGLIGWQSAGKDTVADYLVNSHNYRRKSFAATLKDAVSAVFGWDRELLEGRTRESREWREQVDPWWAEQLGMPDLTPRLILQLWGTEVCRKGFHNNIWIASLSNQLRKTTDDIVITDCRFPNEINAIRELGGKLVWIQRGPLPAWYDTAILANLGRGESKSQLERLKIHASETSWVGEDFDVILTNNGTIDELYSSVKNLVLAAQPSTGD